MRERPIRDVGILARQCQQLLRESRRAIEAALEFGERCAALAVVVGAFGELRLQVHGGQRRAQLMRGVGDERALRRERLAESLEQAVQGMHQRLHFARQAGFGQRFEQIGRATRDVGRDAVQRREAAGDRVPDQQREEGQYRQQRHDRVQRKARREFATRAHRLRHLHHLAIGERAEDAPLAVVGVDGGESELCVLRQHPPWLRHEQLHAVAVPDLHHQRVGSGALGTGRWRDSGERRVGERRRHLLQLVVEERVGFLACAEVGADGGGTDRQQ